MKKCIVWSLGALCTVLLLYSAGEASFAAEKTYSNSIGMDFILVAAGSFTMGTDKNIEDAYEDETPQHRVTISEPFYLGKFEVTQAQWTALMGNNPSKFEGSNNPVEHVSWDDIQVFIQRLNQKEGHKRYRLPTEAEWEYAARAGTESTYSFGNDIWDLEHYAWYGASYDSGSTHPVGKKLPNPWGFYDVHGNVDEWVQDWYGEDYYSDSPATDPMGPESGLSRMLRGGNWHFFAKFSRSACRSTAPSYHRSSFIGFRLALSTDQ